MRLLMVLAALSISTAALAEEEKRRKHSVKQSEPDPVVEEQGSDPEALAKPPARPTLDALDGYQQLKWGASESVVMKACKGCKKHEGALAAETKIAGKRALLIYNFLDGKLVMASMTFLEKHINPDGFVKDYEDIAGLLEKKYGPPDVNRRDRTGGSYEDGDGHDGMALITGNLALRRRWSGPKTVIIASATGDNMKASVIVMYVDAARGDAFFEGRKSANADDL